MSKRHRLEVYLTRAAKELERRHLAKIEYPSLEIAKDVVCFMHGRVSAYLENLEAYLVDGSSIHGVSGGPVFCCDEGGKVVLSGIVTNYFPNQIAEKKKRVGAECR